MSNHREENFLDNLYRFTIFFQESIELFAIKTEKMLKNYKISISIFNTGKIPYGNEISCTAQINGKNKRLTSQEV